jgi:hypothetical protein
MSDTKPRFRTPKAPMFGTPVPQAACDAACCATVPPPAASGVRAVRATERVAACQAAVRAARESFVELHTSWRAAELELSRLSLRPGAPALAKARLRAELLRSQIQAAHTDVAASEINLTLAEFAYTRAAVAS